MQSRSYTKLGLYSMTLAHEMLKYDLYIPRHDDFGVPSLVPPSVKAKVIKPSLE